MKNSKPSIAFCTPCYGGMLTARHFNSCIYLKEDLTNLGLAHDWNIGVNESLVHRARMEMTREFLDSDHTHLMWIDADIEYKSEDVAKLWNLQTDIAVAAYCMKRTDKPLSAWKDGKLVKIDECPKEPFAVDYAGTGFMLISRKAIECVIEYLEARHRKYQAIFAKVAHLLDDGEKNLVSELVGTTLAHYNGQHGPSPAIYMTPIHKGGLESEDYNFCRIAQEAGFKIIMDPSIKLRHWGQFAYAA